MAEAGLDVHVFERSGALGGRAGSFYDTHLGAELDRGQHVLLGCCTNLLDYYCRTNAIEHIFFPDVITFSDGKTLHQMKPCWLTEPFHLVPSLLRLSQLDNRDKLHAINLLKAVSKPLPPNTNAHDWLLSAGQSENAVKKFWSPVLAGALNDDLDHVSARYAAMVVRESMLINRDGFTMGISRVPLGVLHGRLAKQALETHNARIYLADKVDKVARLSTGGLEITSASGRSVRTDYVIIATDPHSLPSGAKELVANSTEKDSSWIPIVTIYLWFKEKLDLPSALCMAENGFQWCINRSDKKSVTSLALVASAARRMIPMSDDSLYENGFAGLCQALGQALPEPCAFRVVKHRSATFSPTTRFEKVRPRHRTSIPKVFLAGDWTDTGWPGTMEGAVRSGYTCAADILAQEGLQASVPVPDLPSRGLARLLFGES